MATATLAEPTIQTWKIQYEPLPAQLRFHQSAAKIKGFCGPVGSGKSAALAQEAFKLAVTAWM
jgi:hypothetical protein